MCDQKMLRPACAYAPSDQSLCLSIEYSMIVKLPIKQHFDFLSFKGGCTDSSASTLAAQLKLNCVHRSVFFTQSSHMEIAEGKVK